MEISGTKLPIDEFWARFSVQENGCWVWTGTINRGYGRFASCGKNHATHRVAYRLAHGDIPDGMMVCHRCDNPPCGNPDHLFLGTNKDNQYDALNKGRRVWIDPINPMPGQKNGRAKLSQSQALWAKQEVAKGRTFASVGRQLGVAYHAISRLCSGKAWGHL